MNLFDVSNLFEHRQVRNQAACCLVTYRPTFLRWADADALFQDLSMSAPLQLETPIIRGVPMPTRRSSCAYGKKPGAVYRYVGIERKSHERPPLLASLWAKVEAETRAEFNFCLCLLYPDGEASLGWHSDDERDLVSGSPIASVSLGAERTFALRVKGTGSRCAAVELAHGSLLVMSGKCQAHTEHTITPESRVKLPRINLTFRSVRGG